MNWQDLKWKLGVFHGRIAENVSRGTKRSPIMRFIVRKHGCHPRREAWLIPVMGKSAFIAIVARKSASHFANGRHFYVSIAERLAKNVSRFSPSENSIIILLEIIPPCAAQNYPAFRSNNYLGIIGLKSSQIYSKLSQDVWKLYLQKSKFCKRTIKSTS